MNIDHWNSEAGRQAVARATSSMSSPSPPASTPIADVDGGGDVGAIFEFVFSILRGVIEVARFFT